METIDSKENIIEIDINKEMQESYLQYSMSVIVGRALPDVRDGLKPVHRRVLYAMNDLNNMHNKPYKKSARVVGDVIGKYHPHGDVAVYDTIVRMAQDFSLRYPLVDGQGNFGSVDGDSPAAQRYTEVRMTRLAEEILEDIDRGTVSWGPNYDDSLMIPDVLPAKFPNLLVNGSSGIAVGMTTNIPPHNLTEVVDGCIALIQNPEITIDQLMEVIPGPDFPTSAIISGTSGIVSAYKKGRGIITIKAVAEIVEEKNRENIVITEIPYQVNKARLIEGIANLVRDKKMEGISDIRDESSREGMRIVINIKRNENAQVVLNKLYKFTQMKTSFGIIMLALNAKNQPVTFNLKSVLEAFIEHRRNVVTRRCVFELKKAEERVHILEGLKKAIDQIDLVIATIKSSKEASLAKKALMAQFSFSERQSQAILEMRLQRLTGLESQKVLNELESLSERVRELKNILSDTKEIYKIIIEELEMIKKKFSDSRKTKIELSDGKDLLDEDLITSEDMMVSMTYTGYIKRIPFGEYTLQRRGGRGLRGADQRDGDFVWKMFASNTHTSLFLFSDKGKLYVQKVYRLPLGKRTSRGSSIANVVQISNQEKIRALLPIDNFDVAESVMIVTAGGMVKKTILKAFSNVRSTGILALTTKPGDKLMDAKLVSDGDDALIVTKKGSSIRFDQGDVRAMGRQATGVKGITLDKEDAVVGLVSVSSHSEDTLLIITSKGYGKRTSVSEYRSQGRGGRGIITQRVTGRTGHVVGVGLIKGKEQLIVTTDQGQTIRMMSSDISIIGRIAQGVRLINLKEGEKVTGMALIDEENEESNHENG